MPKNVKDPTKIKATRGSYAGFVPSRKMNQMIPVMSRMEHQMAILLEADPAVSHYEARPYTLDIVVDGKQRSYTPSFVISRNGKSLVIDVRPSQKTQAGSTKVLLEEVRNHVASVGKRFVSVTENELNTQPRMHNAEYVLRYASMNFNKSDAEIVSSLFMRKRSMTVSDAVSRMGTQSGMSRVCTAVCAGLLKFDASNDFGPETIVSLNG